MNYRQKYYLEHKEHENEQSHEYYLRNKKKLYKINVEWKKNNSDKWKKIQKRANDKIFEKCRKIMDNLKINGCAICGYNKCSASLEFHHVNPDEKKFGLVVGNLKRNNEEIANELNKCILLCANCHMEIHQK